MGHAQSNRRGTRAACPRERAAPRFVLTTGGLSALWGLVGDSRLAAHERESLSAALSELEASRTQG